MSDPQVATAFHFETDRLLSPISAHKPAGDDLRYEGTYDLIADLRREDDRSLDQGVWKADLKRADWPRIAQVCLLAIESRSKDIQIAAWLLEAWTHLHGFAGLREGLHLVAELCDTYWDELHPAIRDGDLEYRLAPIVWIEEKVTVLVKLLPITAPTSDELRPYTLADWELASRQPRPDARDQVSPARFQQSASLTPTRWLSALARDASDARAAVDELRKVLDEHCGRHAPTLVRLRETLETILALCSAAMLGRDDAPRGAIDMENGNGNGHANGNGDVNDAAGENGAAHGEFRPIRTRVEAYQRLAEAAEFLERTEPHSPVPPLVRRAIAWGGLSLEDLLPELIREPNQLAELNRLLQFGESVPKPPKDGSRS